MKTITLGMLKEEGACEDQIKLFKKLFGKEVKPTKALCLKHAHDFNFDWAGPTFLDGFAAATFYDTRHPAWKKWKRTGDAKNYEKATALAFYNAWKEMK